MSASTTRLAPALPPLDRDLVGVAVPPAWPRWTAFRYRLPARARRRRVAVWRALRAAGGINLDQAEWAVPHRGSSAPDLEAARRVIDHAGGSWWCEEVGSSSADHLEAQLRLRRRCDRLWDDVVAALDGVAVRLGAPDRDVAWLQDEIRRLREQFAVLLAADVVESDASGRASARLQALAEAVTSLERPLGGGDAGVGIDADVARWSVHVGGGWMLDDGTARYVLGVRPTPTLGWERALEHFERTTFTATTSRPMPRNGVVAVTCAPERIVLEAEALGHRIELFVRSIVG